MTQQLKKDGTPKLGHGELKAQMRRKIALHDLPDYCVLDKREAAAALDIAPITLNRMHRRGEGPERSLISPRRIGYTVAALKRWLASRAGLEIDAKLQPPSRAG